MISRRSLALLGAQFPWLAGIACVPADPVASAQRKLRRIARPKLPPQPGDWLAQHNEPGQTYQQFRATVKSPAADSFSTLRLVPIGPLMADRKPCSM